MFQGCFGVHHRTSVLSTHTWEGFILLGSPMKPYYTIYHVVDNLGVHKYISVDFGSSNLGRIFLCYSDFRTGKYENVDM